MITGWVRLAVTQFPISLILLVVQLRMVDTTGDINCVSLLAEERSDDMSVYTNDAVINGKSFWMKTWDGTVIELPS